MAPGFDGTWLSRHFPYDGTDGCGGPTISEAVV